MSGVKGGDCLKEIRQKRNALAVFTGLSAIFSILIFVYNTRVQDILMQMLFYAGTLASIWSASFCIREFKKLQIARLIVDNQILNICVAASSSECSGNIEAYISYFGILLGSRIIRYNQNKVFLKAIEIGEDFISFSYGTDKWSQKIRLIRPATSNEEIECIVKQFRDETGVVPVIVK